MEPSGRQTGRIGCKRIQAVGRHVSSKRPYQRNRTPPSVRIPNGRQADTSAIAGCKFPYDPGAIRAPTLVVMGEFDAIATHPGAQWLLKSLRHAPQRRPVLIGRGSQAAANSLLRYF
jgi:hypothetical protein